MNLRGRLLLVVVLLNSAVVGVVQVGALLLHHRQSRQQQEVYAELLQTILRDSYPDRFERVEHRWVRELLANEGFPITAFRDVMVSTGAAPGTEGFVDLNPMGATQRRAEDFSLDQVRRGIRLAKTDGSPVPVAGGLCVPVQLDGVVELGAWYVPVGGLPTALPLELFAVPVVLATLLIAGLAYFSLGRSVVRPLETMGRAAARIGEGEYGVQVPSAGAAPEIKVLASAFNAMSAVVAGNTEELEREVERATDEAARRERAMVVSSRLAAMGTLAAGIAHEINNPLGGMVNAVHRLRQREGLDERSRVYLDLVLEGLDRVGAITRRVLDFSPSRIEAAPFRLEDAVEGARVLVEHRCKYQGVEFCADLADDLPDLDGDRHEIQQVLLNCFINSLDVLEDRAGGRIEVSGVRDRGGLLLSIDDNGPGADAAVLARVLDPFFSAKGEPGASGLGLFISYSIVKNHGGDLEVVSRPGEGFSVRIRLPVGSPGQVR